MNKWNFKTTRRNSKGKIELVDISSEQQAKISLYEKALELAVVSNVANPIFSKYFVKESIGFKGHQIVPAGNIEYGFCQALHGEESAVASLLSFYDLHGIKVKELNLQNLILGIITKGMAMPCGNCRDLLLDTFGENFEIVAGDPQGDGLAIVSQMKDYLYEDFGKAVTPFHIAALKKSYPFSAKEFNQLREITLKEGAKLNNDAYSPRENNRDYYALIVTEKNKFFGSHDVMADYHPIYALTDAIRQARRANDPFIKYVMIVRKVKVKQDTDVITPPHIMYKDRQHLLELNLQAELISGKRQNPPIYIVNSNPDNSIYFWKTSVKEWLPIPFSPETFGKEFVQFLKKYYKNKTRE